MHHHHDRAAAFSAWMLDLYELSSILSAVQVQCSASGARSSMNEDPTRVPDDRSGACVGAAAGRATQARARLPFGSFRGALSLSVSVQLSCMPE